MMFGRLGLGLSLVMLSSASSCGGASERVAEPPSSSLPEQTAGAEETAPPSESEDASDGSSERRRSEKETLDPSASIEELMQFHFKDAERIRAAIVAGSPEKAVKPAYALVHLNDNQKLPKSWAISVERLQEAAARVEDAADVAQAAAATADIGRACGMCHQKFGGPRASKSEAPESDGTISGQMRQHAWATERLWEGLYVPSGAAWEAGTKLLAGTQFPQEVLDEGGVYTQTAAKDFVKIAARAPGKWSLKDRAEVYASLLGTCAACHLSLQ